MKSYELGKPTGSLEVKSGHPRSLEIKFFFHFSFQKLIKLSKKMGIELSGAS